MVSPRTNRFGTNLTQQHRAMLRDPVDYLDPETFNPDRFILDGQINPEVRDPAAIIFGFGRRCYILIRVLTTR